MARAFDGAAFGEQLRREREQRGLAVEAICASTKVPVRHILSLEAGAFWDLPGGVFRRGFLRSYLSALGLEESYWMPRFEESLRHAGVRDPNEGLGSWVGFAENVKNSRYTPRRRNPHPVRTWLYFTVAVFTIGFVWSAARLESRWKILPHHGVVNSVKTWVDKLGSW